MAATKPVPTHLRGAARRSEVRGRFGGVTVVLQETKWMVWHGLENSRPKLQVHHTSMSW